MFTGLVEEIGRVVEVRRQGQGARLVVEVGKVHEGTRVGDSISVSGACQTVVAVSGNQLAFDAVAETLRRSTLGDLRPGDRVNLERALSMGDRLGGHLVQGHVDGIGSLVGVREEGISQVLSFAAPSEILRDMVLKGSITIDGISLTVAALERESFSVALIPETLRSTTLYFKQAGDRVNLESDLIGKYVRRFLETREPESKITVDFLAEHGFT